MKILFIFPKVGSQAKWMAGIAILSAVLKKAGHQVELLEVENQKELTQTNSFVKAHQPDIIGLSANSHQYFYAVQIAEKIKQELDIPIFLGGVHATLKPHQVIQQECFDGICLGEGEYALLELIKKIESGQNYSKVNNFWFKTAAGIIKNDLAPLIEDLDKLPLPDYSIFKYFKQAGHQEIVPRFIFSRGCPFNCTYCCNHVFKKIYANKGKYVRFRNVDQAIQEIELVKKDYNFKHFKIDDDTFSLNKAWVLEFCHKYAKKLDMTFECNVRAGVTDKEALSALKKAGCQLIKAGVETGNENLRKEILGRNISNAQIIELFALAKEIGLLTFSFNMLGVPGETKKTIQDTINLNAKIRPDFMQVTAFYPYPGTLLEEKCTQQGLIVNKQVDSYMENSILKLPGLSSQQIKKVVKNFKYLVYKQYNWRKALTEKKKQLRRLIIAWLHFFRLAKPLCRLVKNFNLFVQNNSMIKQKKIKI